MNVPGGNKFIPVGEDGLTRGTGEEACSSHVLNENPTHFLFLQICSLFPWHWGQTCQWTAALQGKGSTHKYIHNSWKEIFECRHLLSEMWIDTQWHSLQQENKIGHITLQLNCGGNKIKRRSVWHRQDSVPLDSRGISACGLERVWLVHPWNRN